MRKTAPTVKAMFAMTAIMLAALSVMAQDGGKASPAPRAAVKTEVKGKAGARKSSAVAVKRGDRLEFVMGKERMMSYTQRAFDSLGEKAVVKDISIRPFEKVNYLAIQLERQGTLFLALQPTGGGIQGMFDVSEDKYLYCASEGCTSCYLTRAGGPVRCECDIPLNTGPSTGCKLMPRLYVNKLVIKIHDIIAAE